jgi:hypothetical protein
MVAKNPLTKAINTELYNESPLVHKRAGIIPSLILASSLVTLSSNSVQAAVFNVTNNNDAGAGSLRQAIIDSNANAGPDAVVFDNAVTGTITLTSGELSIYEDLAVVGPGSANLSISGNDSSRIINSNDSVNPLVNVEISGLTLSNGSDSGGAIYNSNSNMTIRDSVLSDNNGILGGGALESNGGVVQIIDSQISNNSSTQNGGAIGISSGSLIVRGSTLTGNTTTSGRGGAIFASDLDTLVVDNSTLSGNYSLSGGALYTTQSNGSVLISNSSITGNTAGEGYGGGISNNGFNFYSGSLTIDNTMITGNSANGNGGGIASNEGSVFIKNNSVISNNSADDNGGGVFFNDDDNGQILDIANSTINNNTALSYGGGIHFYADEPDLRIRDTTISGNSSDSSGGGIAIYYDSGSGNHKGAITIQNTTISNNTASNDGGGLMLEVDDFYNEILIENSIISGNSAGGDGGGLHFYFDDGLYTSLIIKDTTISNNSAYEGGGMFFYDDDGYSVTMENSLISGNHAEYNGGGIKFYSDDGALLMSNSTVSGNSAGANGGGLYLTHEDGDSRIENSTIVDNTAEFGGGLYNATSQVTIRSSIIANNIATESNPDIGGGDLYVQFSLIEDPNSISLDQNVNNVFYVDPMLGPLADNGGPTFTHALLAGSPAIDAGLNAAPSADDQRGDGFNRMVGLQTDMGAVESTTDTPLSFPVATQTVTNLNDSGVGSLRQAIIDSNAAPGQDVIEFDAGLNGSIDVSLGALEITDDLIINAPVPSVITIDGAGLNRNNTINGISIENLINITGPEGTALERGGLGNPNYNLMSVDINGLTISNNTSGSGISVANSELTVRNSTISGNTALYYGGGINAIGGVTRILDSTISANKAYYSGGPATYGAGGGISIDKRGGPPFRNELMGALVIRNSQVSSNTAYNGGGGIHIEDGASVAIDNSTVSNNFAFNNTNGGGINVKDLTGSVSISDSIISGNYAYNNGGGIAVNDLDGNSLQVTLNNTTVSDNDTYSGDGAGIYFDANNHRLNILNNSMISNNDANYGDGGGIHFAANDDGTKLLIENSTINNNQAYGDGGGINFYSDDAKLDIIDSTISSNTANDEGGGLSVYYAYLKAPINIIGSTFDGNTASEDGGGILIAGDDIYSSILIEDSTLSNNSAGDDGGGLSTYADDGFYTARFTIRDTVIEGNQASDNGGGLYIFDEDGEADFIIENSTISNNTAGGNGGGLWFYSDDGGFVINNTTVSNNSAAGNGGGFLLEYSETPRNINNLTITGNTADIGGGLYLSSPMTIRSSIISGNTATTGPDIGGDEGFYIENSLLGDNADIGATTLNDEGNNIFAQDPLLGPLADNGGATQTHTLLAGSPAINRGLNFAASATDQRNTGFARSQGVRTDMGAVEVVGSPVLSGTLTGSPIPENAGVGTIAAALTESAGLPTVIDLSFSNTALLDTDFGVDTTFLFVPTGDLASQTPVTITAIDDVIYEGDEPFTATGTSLSGPSPFPVQNGIILEDEGIPQFSLTLVGDPIAENAGVATVTATISGLSALDTTGNFIFTGSADSSDFTSVNSFTIPAGMTTGNFDITAVDDALNEIDETIVLDVDSVTNGQEDGVQQVTTTITDDDAAPLTAVSLSLSSVIEGNTVDVILTIDAPSGQDITITLGFTGTAIDPDDYTVSSDTVVIPAGTTSGMVTITAVDDLLPEIDETIIIDILSVVNGIEDGVQQATVNVISSGPIIPEIIPTLSFWSKILLILTLPFAAVVGLGRRKKNQ